MNISDSERIAGFLEEQGYKMASDISEAFLVIFNTCGVRQMAEDRVYGQIHNLRKKVAAEKRPLQIVLTGCLANRKDVQRRLKNKVDLFCEIKDFPEEIKKNFTSQDLKTLGVPHPHSNLDTQCPSAVKLKIPEQSTDHLTKENIDYLSIHPQYTNTFQAFVPIMTGCNNFCSYCVVPYARGRETSRPAQEIMEEVKDLVQKGYKSITLLGQNVNSYCDRGETPLEGFHPYKAVSFPQLLKKINAIPGKFWIQFVSSHPKDMSAELIETVAKSKKVCELVHLPIQSGSDEILQKMNRPYTIKHYLNLVRKIKAAFKKYKPNTLFALTSDIIVGFPGETEEQFMQSAEIMRKAKYDLVFFGQYSPRPGTAAWKMKDDVSKAEKERREQFLNEILKKTTFAHNKKYKNTVQEVLIEKMGTKFPIGDLVPQQIYFGKTRTGKNVKIISSKKNLVGQFAKVKITKVNVWNLEGTL